MFFYLSIDFSSRGEIFLLSYKGAFLFYEKVLVLIELVLEKLMLTSSLSFYGEFS